jgi:hypothetical protein
MELAGVLVRDARDALDEPAVHARAELHGCSVRADEDRVAVRDTA